MADREEFSAPGGDDGAGAAPSLDDVRVDFDPEDDGGAAEAESGDDGDEPFERAPKDRKPQGGDTRRVALRQERDRRRAAEAKAAQLEATFQQLVARMSGGGQLAPQGRVGRDEPDLEEIVETQPIDALKRLVRTVKDYERSAAETEALEARQRELQQRDQNVRAVVTRALEDDEADFAEETPDYPQAAEFFVGSRLEELMATGLSRPEAAQAVHFEILQTTARLARAGGSPAEAIYKLAQKRGYRAAGTSAKQQFDAMRAGQAAAKSAGAGGRSGARGGVTLSDLANLRGEAFDRAYAKLQRQMTGR
jgi:hypothetical protein